MPQSLFTDEDQEPRRDEEPVHLVDYTPDSDEEMARRGALAWSAGIVFFSSIVFMLFLGWLADLLLGSSPWGIVGGIVLGSIIGFMQFFRISSRIFGSKKKGPAVHPLMPPEDEQRERDGD
jgi:F0F1-type ATP synthase assembly protein I